MELLKQLCREEICVDCDADSGRPVIAVSSDSSDNGDSNVNIEANRLESVGKRQSRWVGAEEANTETATDALSNERLLWKPIESKQIIRDHCFGVNLFRRRT